MAAELLPVRFSASGVGRFDDCEASLARSMEMLEFCRHLKVDPPRSERLNAYSEQGTRLHSLLASIPFASVTYAYGDPNLTGNKLFARVRERAKEMGMELKRGDVWFLGESLKKRNIVFEDLIARVGGFNNITSFEISLDTVRLHHAIRVDEQGSLVGCSGLADARAVAVTRQGTRHVALCDYKTGWAEQEGSRTNRQLTTLAALEAWVSPTVDVAVSLLARADMQPGMVDITDYSTELLGSAQRLVEDVARRSHRNLALYRQHTDGMGGLPAEIAVQIDERAKTGSQCQYCVGKLCCGRLLSEAKAFHREVLAPNTATAKGTRNHFKELAESTETISTMDLESLTKALDLTKDLHKDYAVFDQLKKEGEGLARQLMRKGTVVPEYTLKEGSRRLNLVETRQVPNPEVPGEMKEVECDLSPHAIYEVLTPLLPGVDEAAFIHATTNVDPGMVRDFLADIHKVDPKDVFEQKLKPLGDRNPFEMRPNEPSVVRGAAKVVAVAEAEALVTKAEAPKAVAEEKKPAMPALPKAKEPAAGKGKGKK